MKRLPFSLIIIALLLLIAVGCAALPEPVPTPDPMSPYYADFRPESLPPTLGFENFPRYDIEMRVDPETREIDGTARIHVRNLSGRPLSDLYVRLYPNLNQLVGGMRLKGVVTLPERYAAGFAFTVKNTAIRITLTEPLQPGEAVDLEMQYLAQAPEREGYVLYGQSDTGILSLPYSYPILAAQTGDPTDPWRLDIPPSFGDIAIADPAFYTVTVTAPTDYVMVASGVEISSTETTPGWTDHVFVTGPVREWGMAMSQDFEVESLAVEGTKINSYYLKGDETSGRAALTKAAAALRVFNRLLAPYPYKELDIVQAPTRYLGMEFPGLNYIGIDTYRNETKNQEILVAHEIAHQWWYALVGSDPFRYPWLDEGLAEHSSLLYMETLYGPVEAERMRVLRWQIPVQWGIDHDLDDAVGQEVTAFTAGNYETLVYAKSATFFDALYQQLGREKYLEVLQTYIERHRFGKPTPEDFLAVVSEIGGIDPQPLYERIILTASPKPEAESEEQTPTPAPQ